MYNVVVFVSYFDHCRIGSLENQSHVPPAAGPDHCRIGSLENKLASLSLIMSDHCRIGSLEN